MVGNNSRTVTAQKTNKRTRNFAIAGLIISWTTIWMFLFSPFGIAAWISILIYLIIKRSHLKWYIIFSAWVFVPGCNFFTGTVHYFTGTASLRGVGGPEIYHGIDRETRVPSTSSGCIFLGFEPFVFPANNSAVKLWTNIFGFQQGAYTGIYPTQEEAEEILKSADTVSVMQLDAYYEFVINDISVRLDKLGLGRFHDAGESTDKVIGKMVNNECFIFQRFDIVGNVDKVIYLADIKNRRLLTKYFVYN